MHPDLERYLAGARWSSSREQRMVSGLRVLQHVARRGDRPITYTDFAERIQPGLAPLATAAVLEDIGVFCNAAKWPNVTCFVVSATTGECSAGFSKVSSDDPAAARDAAWFAHAVYKTAPTVDVDER